MGQFGDDLKKKVYKTKPYVITTGVVLLILAIAIIFICTLANSIQSLTWPSTKGIIVKSVLIRKGSGTNSAGRSFKWDIEYSLSVNNVNYTGDTVNFESKQDPNRDIAKKFIAKYRPGAKVDVYYKPSNPKESCLEPGLTRFMLVTLLLCLAAFGMGIVFLVAGFKLPSSKKLIQEDD